MEAFVSDSTPERTGGTRPLTCPHCGAPLEPGAERCAYCGTLFSAVPRTAEPPRRPPRTAADFGLTTPWLLRAGGLVAAGLYALGWSLEDTRYWLNGRAVAVWLGLLPLWWAEIAFLRRSSRRLAWLALPLAASLFALHLGIIAWIRGGHLWDDHIGIAAMVAVASAGGWLLGRLGHAAVRRWRLS